MAVKQCSVFRNIQFQLKHIYCRQKTGRVMDEVSGLVLRKRDHFQHQTTQTTRDYIMPSNKNTLYKKKKKSITFDAKNIIYYKAKG